MNNISALAQIMAWRRTGDKPLSEPMIVYWRIYASLGLNELKRMTVLYEIMQNANLIIIQIYINVHAVNGLLASLKT